MTAAEIALEDGLGHAHLVQLLDYDTVQALKVMRNNDVTEDPADKGRSIRQAAEILNIPDRTLIRNMLAVDRAYHAVTGQNLIKNEGGRVGYRLTEDGGDFAVDAGEVMDNLEALVHDLTVSKGRLTAPTTKACLPMVKRLNDRLLARDSGVWLDPELHRTADIHRPREREKAGPYAFYSIGRAQGDKPYYENQHLELENGTELVVFKAERFKLVAPDSLQEELRLGPNEPVSVTQVLRNRWTLLVPAGGAVYDFLDQNTPSWARLGRPPKDILDLQAGLMCLELGIYERSTRRRSGGGVMIVHTEVEDFPRNYRTYDIQEEHPCWALTGLFRDPDQLSSLSRAQRRRWAHVWQLTRQLWADRTPAMPVERRS